MKIKILTLFPEMFPNVLKNSILGRAEKNNIIEFEFINIRDYSIGNYKKVDDYPFGGGNGMVMMPKPVTDALIAAGAEKGNVVYMSPRGEKVSESLLREFADKDELTILCGHYEGVDPEDYRLLANAGSFDRRLCIDRRRIAGYGVYRRFGTPVAGCFNERRSFDRGVDIFRST